MAVRINPLDAFIAARPKGAEMRPHALAAPEDAKSEVLQIACLVAAIAHLGFIFLFLGLDVPVLAVFNVGSVAAFGVAALLNRGGHLTASVVTICVELTAHAVVACASLGLQWGFQYYLWTIAIFIVVNPAIPPATARIVGAVPLAVLAGVVTAFDDVVFRDTGAIEDVLRLGNLSLAAFPVVIALGAVRRTFEFHTDELARMATIDTLTNIENRRAGLTRLTRTAADSDGPLCAVLADIDHFKAINDTYGHDVGDQVLRRLSDHLASMLRTSDAVVRWGGEEFLVILPGTAIDEAVTIADRLHRSLAEVAPIAVPGGTTIGPVTMSLGLSQRRQGESVTSFLERLDVLLYEAKDAGRDRLCWR